MHAALLDLATDLSVYVGANIGAYALTVANESKGKEIE
jgi:hypothetical protein